MRALVNYLVVEVVFALAHASRAKNCLMHDALADAHLLTLLLQAEERVLQAAQVAAARQISHLVGVGVLRARQPIANFLVLEVQLFHRVYYLPQLDRQRFFRLRNLVQLKDLRLVLLVDSFFYTSD